MTNDRNGSLQADADVNVQSDIEAREDGADESRLASASAGAAADRSRAKEERPEESIADEFDEMSPGLTAEVEADSS